MKEKKAMFDEAYKGIKSLTDEVGDGEYNEDIEGLLSKFGCTKNIAANRQFKQHVYICHTCTGA